MSSATTTAPGVKESLLINRNFTLLLTGQAISFLGDFIFNTTLVLWIAAQIGRGESWAPLAVSTVLISVAVPDIVVGPLAGVFVDRWDKRRTMLWMDALRAILILGLLPVAGIGSLFIRLSPIDHVIAIDGIVFLATCCAQFFSPARLTLVGDIVPPVDLPRASGLGQATMPIASLLGPPIAAPLFFALGPQWALILNALSFAASFAVLLAVRPPHFVPSVERLEPNFGRELREGIRFLAGSPVLRTVLIVATILMLGAGALNALDVFFVRQNLHAPLSLYGLLDACFGAGLLIGAIGAGTWLIGRLGMLRTFWTSTIAASAVILLYARMTSFAPAAAFLFIAAMPVAALNVTLQPILLTTTPRELVGRVGSVLQPAISLASIISMALAGVVASTLLHGFHGYIAGVHFGPIDTVFTIGGLLCLSGGIYAWLALRAISLPSSNEKVPPAGVVPAG